MTVTNSIGLGDGRGEARFELRVVEDDGMGRDGRWDRVKGDQGMSGRRGRLKMVGTGEGGASDGGIGFVYAQCKWIEI